MNKARLHFMDIARSFVLLLGIPYHVAMFYVAGETWLINSSERSEALTILIDFTRVFRMPFFFFVAGYFSFVSFYRHPSGWLKSRLFRITVPLATGIITLTPIQILAQIEAGSYTGEWLYHLWFLLVLIIYTLAYAIFVHRALIWIFGKFHLDERTILTTSVILNSAMYLAVGAISQIIDLSAFHLPIRQAAQYIVVFVFGAAIASNSTLRDKMTGFNIYLISISFFILIGLTIFQSKEIVGLPVIFRSIAVESVKGAIAIPIVLSILSLCRKYLNSRNFAIEDISSKSLMIYMFHHPIIILMCLVLMNSSLDPAIGFAVMCTLAVAISYLLAWAVSRSRYLYFLYNGFIQKVGAK